MNPCATVQVIARVNDRTSLGDAQHAFEEQYSLAQKYFCRVLAPAIDALPENSRTRQFNTSATVIETEVLPDYFMLYAEDIHDLSQALATTPTPWCPYTFYFATWKFGQKYKIDTLPITLPDLRLEQVFDDTLVDKVSFPFCYDF